MGNGDTGGKVKRIKRQWGYGKEGREWVKQNGDTGGKKERIKRQWGHSKEAERRK